jgi:GT2 family glycosyltransferase
MLARCLGALAGADPPPGQVLVVDQDPQPATAAALAELDGVPHRYLVQDRRGLSASRNLALDETTTWALAVTDDDCVPDRGWVGALAAALDRGPRPAAVTGPILSLGPRPVGMHAVSLREAASPTDHRTRVPPWTVGSGANFAAPVDVLRAAGGWDQRLGVGATGQSAEDADLVDRLLRVGDIVRFTPDAVIRHDWQTWERRLATRWSYGYGIGVLAGFVLRARDRFGIEMLAAYLRPNVRALAAAIGQGDRAGVAEYARAVTSAWPGLVRGLLTGRQLGR